MTSRYVLGAAAPAYLMMFTSVTDTVWLNKMLDVSVLSTARQIINIELEVCRMLDRRATIISFMTSLSIFNYCLIRLERKALMPG